ncbi:glycoside hydrolase family 78 protein [Paenarthrobacter aurescens]|uniref:glycoside hydrolase family 78 protein n=1 Tax=Paenarthrobacter aurescens TaxID=43663 RepID=UPI0021C1CCA5|nr:glycoside hydrolase family 78 protein [Paenarthrobacter aurescens]MCT9869046.1 glycoside hydrolase family 78 protein [Paenarthrobacter aurescens]
MSAAAAPLTAKNLAAKNLTVDGITECLIASAAPHFGWLLDADPSAGAGQSFQGAYRIRVFARAGTEVWDSGTVVTEQQHHLPYTGPALKQDSDYQWTVQLTDADGNTGEPSPPAYFSTGLPEAGGWNAEWIHRKQGGRAPMELVDGFLRVSGSPYLPWPASSSGSTVITARFRLRLGTAGILLRSDGPGTGLLVEIKPNRSVLLRPAPCWAIGAMSAPPTEPLAETPAFEATAPSRAGAVPEDGWQDLVITDDGEHITVSIDDVIALDAVVPVVPVVPVVSGNTATGIAFHQGPRSQAEYSSVGVRSGGSALLTSDFTVPDALSGWTTTTPFRQPDEWTLVKATFKLTGTVVRARLHAAASHHASFTVNGSPCLETSNFGYPGEHFYNAADVTDALQSSNTASLTAVAHWYGPGQGRAAGRPGLLAQLTVEYDDGTRDVFGSGPGWMVAEGPYRQSGYRNDEGDPIEHFDATAWPEPHQWSPALSLGTHPVPDFPFLRPNDAGVARNYASAVEIFTADDGTPVADFGAVIPGRPVVEFLRGEHGRTVMLRAGYNLRADGRVDSGKTPSQNTDMSFPYTQVDGPQRYEAAVHLGFRYLEMPGVELADLGAVGATVIHAEHPEEGSFHSSDHTLNRVFTLLRDSALLGVQEQFVDTPTREKGQFLGDAVNISYATMALFCERQFTAKALREFAGSARRYWDSPHERGRYNAVYPNGDGKRDIPDFSLMMPEWVEDYYRLSGDGPLVDELLPHLQDTAEYVLRHIPGDGPTAGLVTDLGGGAGPYLHGIVDWPAPGRFGYDMDCAARTTVNAQGWSVLDAVSRLCGVAGLQRDATRYGQAAASLAERINSRLRVDGVMVDGLYADGRPSLNASQHATSFPLSLGITPSEDAAKDAERIAGMGMRQGPMTVHRLFRALLSQKRVDDVLALLTDSGQPGWARQLEAGASFTWEAWELDEGTDYSQSHAWSASVVREIMEHLLGVRVTAPGGSAVVIEPPACRLEHAQGSVPTQRGVVAVSWRRTPDGMELGCTIPAGVTAQLVLPTGRHQVGPGSWHFPPRADT